MSMKDFEIVSKLGDGAYSTVYKVIRKQDNKIYALKRVKMSALSSRQKQNALNQIRILASLSHPNVISYKQAFVDQISKSLCIVMEFANNGDLAYRIEEKIKKNTLFEENQIWNIFIQIVKGLNSLHQFKIFHRDIKPANIFLHQQNNVIQAKLGDMNVSKISEKGLCMTQTGTPYYASPQVWKDKPYDSKSDIWSLGCVLYQMITLKQPFMALDMEGLYKKVVRGIYPRIPPEYSQDLSSMIRNLLQTNPQMRPSCQKILKMSSVIKRMYSSGNTNPTNQVEQTQRKQLLKTIKAGQNFHQLNQNLPKSNYLQSKYRKQKGIKSLIEAIQQKTNNIQIIDSLPLLQKQRKIKLMENSEKMMLKEKQSINLINKDRKKSEIIVDRNNKSGLEINNNLNIKNNNNNNNTNNSNSNNNNNGEFKQLKLPKVQNRYNKIKQRIYKQNSLRIHKICQ